MNYTVIEAYLSISHKFMIFSCSLNDMAKFMAKIGKISNGMGQIGQKININS